MFLDYVTAQKFDPYIELSGYHEYAIKDRYGGHSQKTIIYPMMLFNLA